MLDDQQQERDRDRGREGPRGARDHGHVGSVATMSRCWTTRPSVIPVRAVSWEKAKSGPVRKRSIVLVRAWIPLTDRSCRTAWQRKTKEMAAATDSQTARPATATATATATTTADRPAISESTGSATRYASVWAARGR